MTETVILAFITAVVTIAGSYCAARSVIRTTQINAKSIADKARLDAETAADALYSALCKDLMARIKDLLGQIDANNQRVTALEEQTHRDRLRIALLEADNARLTTALAAAQAEMIALGEENKGLKQTLKTIQAGR